MPDSNNDLNGMIARIEEANARAYKRFERAVESVSNPEQDAPYHPPVDQPVPPALPKRQSSRVKALLLVGLLLAATACVTAFAWEPSYREAAKLIIARWAKPTWSGAQTVPRESVPLAPLIPPEVAQQFEKMADDLTSVKQRIDQLKASQEQIIRSDLAITGQLKANQEQLIRSEAAFAEQAKANQEQLGRDNAKVVEQLSAAIAQLNRTKTRRRITTAPASLTTGTLQTSPALARSAPGAP
jgi:hypothetical protein